MTLTLDENWKHLLNDELEKEYFKKLIQFVDREYKNHIIFPPQKDLFNAFNLCSLAQTRVVILGQDPYHDMNQAHGLCFSVNEGEKTPPSLVNIFKELHADLGIEAPSHGNLTRWANQGVLLLNATLTVRAHEAGSHQKKGWEQFTDAVIHKLSQEKKHLVFLLWGAYAIKKSALIDSSKHLILSSAHPSPLSAYRGFLGNQHFSKTNTYLLENKLEPISW